MSEQLRKAIEDCGLSRFELAKRSGVAESVLSRFVVSGRELRSGNLDQLCKTLGLRLAPAKPAKRGKGQ